jgi:DNA-directed RNA polymerase subunit RPC12/RpoP
MALITCKECGHNVSETANKCPSCGVKLMPKTSGLTKFAALLISITFGLGLFFSNEPSAPQSACRPLDPVLMRLPASHAEDQADFLSKAERLQASGVCVTDGNWGESYQRFYFSVHNLGQANHPYFIRLTREELKS